MDSLQTSVTEYKKEKVTQWTQNSIQMLSNYIYEVCDIYDGELIEGFINYTGYFQWMVTITHTHTHAQLFWLSSIEDSIISVKQFI